MEIKFKNRRGLNLSGILLNEESDKSVIITHGFGRNKYMPLYRELSEDLAYNGYKVLLFDFSGNGGSEGNFSDITYSDYVDDTYLAVEFLKPISTTIYYIGHSMDANLGVIYQALYGGLDKLVLLAPGFNISKLPNNKWNQLNTYGFLPVIRYLYESGKHVPKHDKLPKSYYIDRMRFNYNQLEKLIKNPMLILIGQEDEIIDSKSIMDFFNNLKCEKYLDFLEGEDHGFHHSDKKILNKILNFFG